MMHGSLKLAQCPGDSSWIIAIVTASLRQLGHPSRARLAGRAGRHGDGAGHNCPEVLEAVRARFSGMKRMQAEDITDAVTYFVTRPRHVAINEILIRPIEQE